jgi:hypothetical protein
MGVFTQIAKSKGAANPKTTDGPRLGFDSPLRIFKDPASKEPRGAGLQDRIFSNARAALANARKLMEKGKITKATFAKIEKKLNGKMAPGNETHGADSRKG